MEASLTATGEQRPEISSETARHARGVLAGACALALAANILVFGHVPGLGWALFAVAVWSATLGNRAPGLRPRRHALAVLAALALATAAQAAIRPSGANSLSLCLITALFAAARGRVNWRALPEYLANGWLAPFRFPHGIFRAARSNRPENEGVPLTPGGTRRAMAVALPAATLVAAFAILVVSGNGLLRLNFAHAVTALLDAIYEFEYPGPARIAFVLIVACSSIGLLWRHERLEWFGPVRNALARSWNPPADLWVAIWRSRAMLVGVNVVFLAANTADALYLWANTALPEELTLAEFVHEGTANLVASTIIAGIVLALIFRQDRAITTSPWMTGLALLWIAQNLVLVSSVILRISIYVDGYGLSLLRLYLVLSLLLIAVGFVLVAIGIVKQRSTGWIVGGVIIATCAAVFGLQFWDARAHVARTNFALAKEWKITHTNHLYIDASYLASLGPSAYPTLVDLAGGAEGFSPNEIQNARRIVGEIRNTERVNAGRESWEDFSVHRKRMRALVLHP